MTSIIDLGRWYSSFCIFSLSLFIFYCFLFYSNVYTLFRPFLPLTPFTSRQNLFCPLLQLCWRENIRDNKKDIRFLLALDKDNCTERFLALLPWVFHFLNELFTSVAQFNPFISWIFFIHKSISLFEEQWADRFL
jgi:hypothetical protein